MPLLYENIPDSLFEYLQEAIGIFYALRYKAVVGGTAGPAMAVPLFGRKWFWLEPFSGRLYISFYFLPGNFSADKILSNNIDNLSVHRPMFCLPRGVKHSRYKNMILKLTPLLTTLTIIKGLSFEVRVHQRLL